jgi:hypothetical protein|tara:strand:- start:51 stop:488 length:438 start_codon:yes stop_codon:yes gene_type:complete
MKFSEIKEMVDFDSKIDGTELDIESIKIPQLHNKYLILMQDEKLVLRSLISKKNTLYRLKWEYYTGKMGKEELEHHGWEPFQLNVLKKDLDIYLDSDADLNIIRDRLAMIESKISYLEEIVKELNSRAWKIKNAIEWRKFTAGGF